MGFVRFRRNHKLAGNNKQGTEFCEVHLQDLSTHLLKPRFERDID